MHNTYFVYIGTILYYMVNKLHRSISIAIHIYELKLKDIHNKNIKIYVNKFRFKQTMCIL